MRCAYCPTCGSETVLRDIGDEGPVPYCKACGKVLFDTPSPCVLVLAVNAAGEVVLLRQSYVSERHWVLVAGYCKAGETVEQAVAREVEEETGLTVTSSRYIASYYHEGRDALMLGFLARVEGRLASESVEVDESRWAAAAEAESLLRPGSIAARLLQDVKGIVAAGWPPRDSVD